MTTTYADSQQIYDGPEFQHWADEEGLIAAERFLIDSYLHSENSTLEAGTGGGRILRALSRRGYTSLAGFDSVPRLVEQARLKDSTGGIALSVQDARSISYRDGEFDQIIYMQQILCFVSDSDGRRNAVEEAFRVLKPNGTALFSFLCLNARAQSYSYRGLIKYIACLRAVTRRKQSLQYLPFLRIAGKPNYDALLDRPPYVYWFRCEEAVRLLTLAGFQISALGTAAQIKAGQMCASVEELHRSPIDGML